MVHTETCAKDAAQRSSRQAGAAPAIERVDHEEGWK